MSRMTMFFRGRDDLQKEIDDLNVMNKALQKSLGRAEYQHEQYQKMWLRDKGDVNTLRTEIRLLNRALARKNHRIASLVFQRNQRDLALADANDVLAQLHLNAGKPEFVTQQVAELRDDINQFCGARHGGAWDKQQKLFPRLSKLLSGPNGICNDPTVPLDQW